MSSKWNRNQIIAVWAIIVPSVLAIIALFFQVHNLDQKIQPQIINVINNITRVEKEIANLNEMLRQQDNLRQVEIFSKSDLNNRVKKISDLHTKLLLFELKMIPLRNSISVIRSEGPLKIGEIPPGVLVVSKNIVGVQFASPLDNILEFENYFWNISYLPDIQSKEEILKVNTANCKDIVEEQRFSCSFQK